MPSASRMRTIGVSWHSKLCTASVRFTLGSRFTCSTSTDTILLMAASSWLGEPWCGPDWGMLGSGRPPVKWKIFYFLYCIFDGEADHGAHEQRHSRHPFRTGSPGTARAHSRGAA